VGTITAGTIIDRISNSPLNDPDNDQWPRAELRAHLSEGQRAAVLLRPEVNPVTKSFPCVAGTKQTIPDDAYVLIDVIRNLGEAGNGRVITPNERAAIDADEPMWHDAHANPIAENFVHDVRNRKVFYLSPPRPAAPGSIEIVVAEIPADLDTDQTPIVLDDIYEPALRAYALFCAFEKDVANVVASAERAKFYAEWFTTLITGNADQKDVELVLRQEARE